MPVSNRQIGRVSFNVKVDSKLWEEFTALLWALNRRARISKAEVIEALLSDWIEETRATLGPGALVRWAADLESHRESRLARARWFREAAAELAREAPDA